MWNEVRLFFKDFYRTNEENCVFKLKSITLLSRMCKKCETFHFIYQNKLLNWDECIRNVSFLISILDGMNVSFKKVLIETQNHKFLVCSGIQ